MSLLQPVSPGAPGRGPVLTGAPAAPGGRGRRRRVATPRIAPSRSTTWVVLVVTGGLMVVPLVSMLEFSLRSGQGYGIAHWAALVDPGNDRRYRILVEGVTNSLILAAIVVVIVLVLLLPTMLLVHLRFARLARALELVCLVPITVPAIVLVVGLAPVYSVVAGVLGSETWTLAFAYGILVLPYAYRAIQANLASVDIVTLAEAARTLGAGWGSVLVRVLLPNLRSGVLAASVISVAVVLGEYTIAALLNRVNLQTSVVQVSRSDPYAAVIFALLALLFSFLLLLLMGRGGRARRR